MTWPMFGPPPGGENPYFHFDDDPTRLHLRRRPTRKEPPVKALWVPDGPIEEYDPVKTRRRWPLRPSTRGAGKWYSLRLVKADAPRAEIVVYAASAKTDRQYTVDSWVVYNVYESPTTVGVELTASAEEDFGYGRCWPSVPEAEAAARQVLTDIADGSQMHVNVAQWDGTAAGFPLGAKRREGGR